MLNSEKCIGLAALCAVLLTGCQTQNAYTDQTQTSNATRGAVIGGLAGAAIGALSNPRDATENALIGGAIGAVAGGVIGNQMDHQEAELRQQLRQAGVSVTRQGNNIYLNMQDDILFRVDAAYLEPRARDIIRSVGLVVKKYGDTYVGVNGYTDTIGTREHNTQLSQLRAEAVADELVRSGIDPRRISPRGYGESNLRIQTPDNTTEVRNRRVEIVLEARRG